MQDVAEIFAVGFLMLCILGPIFYFVNHMVKQRNMMEMEKLKLQQTTLAAAAGVANPMVAQQSQQAQQVQAELLAALKGLSSELSKQNSRLQNLESIVTSPGFLAGQGLHPDFHALSEEQQAAELAKQIAIREGRNTAS